MANNFTVRDSTNASLSVSSTDIGASVHATNHRICDATAANFMPTMDAAARKGFVALTDGTNTGTVKAASVGAALTDTAAVVSLSPNNAATIGKAKDLAATVTAIKASAGVLKKLIITNAHASAASFIQIFDLATGSVVLGTTVPDLEIRVAAGTTVEVTPDFPFATAISIASTTTVGGAVGSAVGTSVYWTRF